MHNSSYRSIAAKFYDSFIGNYDEDVDIIKGQIQSKDKTIIELPAGTDVNSFIKSWLYHRWVR